MNMMESMMDEYKEEKYIKTFTPNTQLSRIEGIFVFGITWSIGASSDEDSRFKFDSLFKLLIKKKSEEDEKEGKERHEKISHPTEKTLYNFVFVKEGPGTWEPWESELKAMPAIPREVQMNQIIVPTIDTIRYTALMKILVTHGKPLLIVGPTGTGKSVYVTVMEITITSKIFHWLN